MHHMFWLVSYRISPYRHPYGTHFSPNSRVNCVNQSIIYHHPTNQPFFMHRTQQIIVFISSVLVCIILGNASLIMGNEQSVLQHDLNSNPYSSATASLQKPTKSAMRKSRSIRQVTDELSRQDIITSTSASRYIPNMNPRTAGNGLIMPTRPYGGHPSVENKAHGSNSAEMSPQWGWYINTTPPTPELYHKRSSSYSSTFNKQQLVKGDSSTIDGKSCQNRVFQDLQNSKKTNPMGGWTSIPI